jgi:hypothetical protein
MYYSGRNNTYKLDLTVTVGALRIPDLASC